jgi:uncharacterized protein (DUF58 family)
MSVPPASRFLDLRALAALEHLRFAPRQRIEGTYSGRHVSRRQGGAGEFADFREYSEGEDLRRLDWKVLARTGRAYTRVYQDETNVVCTLVIDASASMLFPVSPGGRIDNPSDTTATQGGNISKLEYVQFLATALSQIIGRQQDQVGVAIAAGELREFLPPGSTSGHLAHLQGIVAETRTEPVTNLAGALGTLFQRLNRRGVLMILSDFLVDDLEAVFAAVQLFRHRRFEVIALQIVHPEEERLPEGTAYRFEGLEGEGWLNCSPAEIRMAYQERFEHHALMVRTLALAAGCDYHRVSTSVPYLNTLSKFLVERTG